MTRYLATALVSVAALMGSQAMAQTLSLFLSPPGEQNTTRPGAIIEDFNRSAQKLTTGGTWAVGTYTVTPVVTRTPTPPSADQHGAGPDLLNAGLYGGAGGAGQYLFVYRPPEAVRVNFLPAVDVKYVGFWWPAGNTGNELQIFDTTGHSLATFTATEVFNLLAGTGSVTALNGTTYPRTAYRGNPNRPPAGNTTEPFAYINILLEGSSASIGSVEIRGTNFEVDNLAIAPAQSTDPRWVPVGPILPISAPAGSIGAKDDELIVVPTTPPSGATGDVSTNDTTVPGSTFSVPTGSEPAHGDVVMNPDGSYTYTPDAGYKGTDTFTYQQCKPVPEASVCVRAKVTIKVVPDAVDDEFKTNVEVPVSGNVSSNDAYPSGSTFHLQTPPNAAHGALTTPLDGATGTFTFTPAPGFSGTTTFTYRLCLPPPDHLTCSDDATVTIHVPPIAAPTASSVQIPGPPVMGTPLTGLYVYSDVNGDEEAVSTFRWVTSTTATPVGGNSVGTAPSYTPSAADAGKNLFFCITPVAATGTDLMGAEVCSPARAVPLAAGAGAGPTAIPTLSTWALLTLGMLIGLMAMASRRQRL